MDVKKIFIDISLTNWKKKKKQLDFPVTTAAQ